MKPGPPAKSPSERFHGKYAVNPDNGCWEWTGSLNNHGYGRMSAVENGRPRCLYAHRVSYELHNGPIPDDLVVDHICNNPRCVNPEHLQLLTQRQNVLRSEAPHLVAHWTRRCLRGHDLNDPANAYVRPDNGKTMCRECIRIRQRSYDARNRRSA